MGSKEDTKKSGIDQSGVLKYMMGNSNVLSRVLFVPNSPYAQWKDETCPEPILNAKFWATEKSPSI